VSPRRPARTRTILGPTTTQAIQPSAGADGGIERRTALTHTIRSSADEAPAPEAVEPEPEPVEEPAAEEAPIELGEILPTEPVAASSLDSISSTVTHKSTVSEAGAAPSGFGVTRSTLKLDNAMVTHAGTVFTLTADLVQAITWKVRSGTGPSSQKDIASETDADITATNYPRVVTDLTPNTSDTGGRPPRTKFWAEDITKVHEIFHTTQRSGTFGTSTATAVKASLDAKTASNEAGVRAHLTSALNDGVTAFNALVAQASTEEDAYKDGVSLYTTRKDAIQARGDKGLY
jgi:hypothetical protein